MTGERPKQIYKITYPNGKIYVGMDLTGDLLYLGSPSAATVIASDLKLVALPRNGRVAVAGDSFYTISLTNGLVLRKEILWESVTAADSEVRQQETRFIRDTRANDPRIGYNKVPKLCS